MLWSIINAAFFPYASKSDDKLAILRNVRKATPYVAAAFLPSFLLLEWIAFLLYGRLYPFSWETALFFYRCSNYELFLSISQLAHGFRRYAGSQVNTLSSINRAHCAHRFRRASDSADRILGAAITLVFAYLIAASYLLSKRRVLRAD